jgi:hypothetical protein
MKSKSPLVLLLGTLVWSLITVKAAEPPRPNILFVIADDWGFGHAGAYGCKWVKTPAFDRVADQGVLFSQAYTPNAKCAVSRQHFDRSQFLAAQGGREPRCVFSTRVQNLLRGT